MWSRDVCQNMPSWFWGGESGDFACHPVKNARRTWISFVVFFFVLSEMPVGNTGFTLREGRGKTCAEQKMKGRERQGENNEVAPTPPFSYPVWQVFLCLVFFVFSASFSGGSIPIKILTLTFHGKTQKRGKSWWLQLQQFWCQMTGQWSELCFFCPSGVA